MSTGQLIDHESLIVGRGRPTLADESALAMGTTGEGAEQGEGKGEGKGGGKGEGEGDGDGEGDEEGAVYSGDQAAEGEDTDGMGVAARGLVRHVNERLRGRRVRRAGQGGEEKVWDEPRRV